MGEKVQRCRLCINDSRNPIISFDKAGYCNKCSWYLKEFDRNKLAEELVFAKSFIGKSDSKYDCIVGVSGGKDSTATLYMTMRLGFTPMAFSFDTGYYPKHIFARAKAAANLQKVAYERIDIRKYIRECDRKSYELMADLYDESESPKLSDKFRRLYQEEQRHDSPSCSHAIPFVRTCRLCRRVVIRAYYDQAIKHGVRLVILGMNEWAGKRMSAIRELKPYKDKPAVYVVHLPFLLQMKITDTKRILKRLGWRPPKGERLVESNSNSCLLARAASEKATRMLGFNPDTVRLAREVTVGFITRKQAALALSKPSEYRHSVREVLKNAKII
jgi:PP-loop superfamily ATP-utilizing enzyme